MDLNNESDCKCTKLDGHLEAVKWILPYRKYTSSPGCLFLEDWTRDQYIWLYYVESSDGLLPDDDALISTDTRYWSIHDVQRYFVGDLHCERVLFTYQYPNLKMPTCLGRHLWQVNTATKSPPRLYTKQLNMSIEHTLKKIETNKLQLDRLIVPDQLICLDRMDSFKRRTFLRMLLNILSFQDRLQLVSFENMRCTRYDGVRLVQQLACFNANSVKYLFLWRFVLPNENPMLVNYSYITGSGQYLPRSETRHCFLRSLGEMRNLRVLALEYSHIANEAGSGLLSLLPVIKRPHFRLQLICREEQIPGRTDPSRGVAGYFIPDTAWRRVSIACPDLYVQITFHRLRHYDDLRRFLAPSIPLREVHLEYGIDLKLTERHDSDISCFYRHLAHHYGNCLVALSVHQWRSSVFPLQRVLELLPRLVRLIYVGNVKDEIELRIGLNIIACGVCDKLRHVNILVQDETNKRQYWQKVIEKLTEEYKSIFSLYQIDFCLGIYKN